MKNQPSQDSILFAPFNRFEIAMPYAAVMDCSHSGACDDDVAHWQSRITRDERCTPEALRAELEECGAWDAEDLSDDSTNWNRIVWIAACQIKEEMRDGETISGSIKLAVSDLYADLLAAINAGNLALAQSLANSINAGI